MIVRVDGIDVFVHAPGGVEADQPAIVFLHGAGMDHTVWRYQTRRAAAAGWTAVAPDYPGHGRSGGEPLASIEALAQWVAALGEELGLSDRIVVGHSMGSLVALGVAASRSDVIGVGLIATAGAMVVHPELLESAERADHHAVDLMVGWSTTGDRRLGGHPDPGVWPRALVTRTLEANLERNLAVDLRACQAYDPVGAAAQVEVPVLIVAGGADLMTRPSSARSLAEHLSDVEYVEIPGASHLGLLDNPRPVTALVLSWATRVRVSGE